MHVVKRRAAVLFCRVSTLHLTGMALSSGMALSFRSNAIVGMVQQSSTYSVITLGRLLPLRPVAFVAVVNCLFKMPTSDALQTVPRIRLLANATQRTMG